VEPLESREFNWPHIRA